LTNFAEPDSLRSTVTSRTGTSAARVAVARTLIVLTAWLSVAPALHGGDHDRDCDPAVLVHDASQHRISAASSGTDIHSDHCVACHLFRSSRHVAAWKFLRQAVDGRSLALQIDSGAVVADATVPLPARAPPALA
jgi:hypothetical protein